MTEDIFRDPDEWLKYVSELFQKTRQLWHSRMDTASDEFCELDEHVQEMERCGNIFTKFAFPTNLVYQQKAGLVLVSSGSVAVLCDIAVRWFDLTRGPSAAAEREANIVFLGNILLFLVHYTDHGAAVCRAVQDHQRLVPALLTRLDELYEQILAGTYQEEQTDVVRRSLIIIHNMSSFEENVQYLREHAVRVLRSYTMVNGENIKRIRFTALSALAELVTEENVDMLATDTDMGHYILVQLEEALQSVNAYSSNSLEVTELIRAIANLAKNDTNKLLLVNEGVLPFLQKVYLKHSTCAERKEWSGCHESTRALLSLVDLDEIKEYIMENTQLLDCVVNIYCDQSRNHSQACFETAKSVLFKLRHCLQRHEHHKRIGCQIEYENTDQLYTMSSRPRGHCLIINNRDFYKDPTIQGAKELTSRHGTNLDRDKLLVLFGGLEFIVTCRNNLTDSQILRQLNVTADLPHDDCNMFVCCILSHGAEGRVYGANGVTVTISSLTRPFTAQLCPSLAGKPKLFFLQACQGAMRQQGCEIEEDAAPEVVRPRSIPNEADFLLGYCTAPGYTAYRDGREGSWYIAELCEVLGNHYDHLDMLEILTNVNKRVSQKIECDGEDVFHQIPAPMYTLRKKLVLGK